jgi:hypothetical protein
MDNVKSIEKHIENSLREISKIYKKNDSRHAQSRLIFPKKSNGKIRVSEQEARFLFVQEIEKQKEFYYSVETPTEEKFKGFAKENPELAEDGRSGAVDVSLHNSSGEKLSHIEFKCKTLSRGVKKDFLKLLVEKSETGQNYFIHIVEKFGSRTVKTNEKYYSEVLKSLEKTTKKSKLKIFLFAVESGDRKVYEIDEHNAVVEIPGGNHGHG